LYFVLLDLVLKRDSHTHVLRSRLDAGRRRRSCRRATHTRGLHIVCLIGIITATFLDTEQATKRKSASSSHCLSLHLRLCDRISARSALHARRIIESERERANLIRTVRHNATHDIAHL